MEQASNKPSRRHKKSVRSNIVEMRIEYREVPNDPHMKMQLISVRGIT